MRLRNFLSFSVKLPKTFTTDLKVNIILPKAASGCGGFAAERQAQTSHEIITEIKTKSSSKLGLRP